MKISQLLTLLKDAQLTHGDIEVSVSERVLMGLSSRRTDYLVNNVVVKREQKSEEVDVSEKLSEMGNPKLVISHITPEVEED